MQIPGHIDPVTTGTVPLRGGNRIDLVGLTRDAIGGLLVEAGLDAKAAKLRAKQIWHWMYHRGVPDFDALTDIAQTLPPCDRKSAVQGNRESVSVSLAGCSPI